MQNRIEVSGERTVLGTLPGRRKVIRRLPLAAAAAATIACLLPTGSAQAANMEYDVTNTTTDLTAVGTYTTGGTAGTGAGGTAAASPPSITSDVTFDSGVAYSPASFTINGSSLSFGSLNDLGTTALTIANTGSAAETLTLGGGSDPGSSVPGSSAGDLLFIGTGASLNLTGGSGNTALGLVLGQSGNFDVAGSSTIGSIISGGFGITKTGAGTLTLGGGSTVNTFSGGLTVSSGTVAFSTNSALGGTTGTAGAVSLNGGTLQMNIAGSFIINTHVITVGSNGGTIQMGLSTSNHPTYVINNGTTNLLTGSGNLTVSGVGTLGVAGSNASVLTTDSSNNFTGNTTILNGAIVEYKNNSGLGTGGTVTVGGGIGSLGELSTNTTISRAITVINGGYLAFQDNSTSIYSGAITLSGAATVRLQDWYSTTVRNGTISSGGISGSGSLTVDSGTGSGGVLTLSGTDNYTGNTNITASTVTITGNSTGATGTFYVGVNPALNSAAGTLTLNGSTGSLASNADISGYGGTFSYQGASAGSTLVATGYTFAGDIGIQSTYGSTGTTSITLSGVAARTVGSTLNLSTSGGTTTTNQITFSSAPTTGTLLSDGIFFGGSSYAAYDTGGFARAYNYSSDTNGFTSTGGTTFGATSSTSNVDLTTAPVTAQTTTQINTLRLGTTNGVAMAASNTLTVAGILKSGGNSATISGGTGIQASSGGELVIRTNASTDQLTISTAVLNNGGSSLTKSGVGTLILSNTANAYAGGTTLDAGTLSFAPSSGSASQTLTGNVTLNGGTLYSNDGNLTLGGATDTITVNGPTILQKQWGYNQQTSGAFITKSLNLTGILQGSGALTLQGTGNNGSEGSAVVISNASDTYSGIINVIGNSGSTGFVMVDGANNALQYATINATGAGTGASYLSYAVQFASAVDAPVLGALSGSSNVILNDIASYTSRTGGTGVPNGAAVALTVGGNNASTLYSGVLSGTGSLTKLGVGTMNLVGASSYTGRTTINGGTLNVTGSLASGSAVTIGGSSASGTPTLTGTGTVGGTVGLASAGGGAAGKISPGTVGGVGTLTTGAETWNGGTYQWDIVSAGTLASGVNGTPGTTFDDLVATAGLTAPTAGAVTIAPTGSLGSIAGGTTYTWVLAQINTLSVGGNSVALGSAVSADFALSTSGLTASINGGASAPAAGTFALYFEAETVGGSTNDLVLSYTSAPEPGTAMLVLGGTLPMLMGRRRRKLIANAENS